jgi:hypothetical protein
MDRRKFISKTALATAGAFVVPYILPSGRLFAASGVRLANHVVFVLFAGGIRNQESVKQQYLLDQGVATTGNVMPNMLTGSQPTQNLVYQKWTPVLTTPLQQQGTLFKEMRYKDGPTGHYNGHTVGMTGAYTYTGLNLNINPEKPTIFEYYRKHYEPEKSAINAWWLSEGLGPYPSLNYSRHEHYGSQYGANYMRPATTFGQLGVDYYSNLVNYQPDDVGRIRNVRDYLNANFDKEAADLPGIQNTEADRDRIRQFITGIIQGTNPVEFPTPTGTATGATGDLVNIAAAWKVLQEFKPELIVCNTTNLDVCHSNFSNYIDFLHKADYGVGWLWNKIQGTEGAALGLKDDTILTAMPEHGRNGAPNSLVDQNGLRAYDHTGDDNSREVFCLIAGPPGVIVQNQVLGTASNPVGESIDAVPTIAKILGFDTDIPPGMLDGSVLSQAFV